MHEAEGLAEQVAPGIDVENALGILAGQAREAQVGEFVPFVARTAKLARKEEVDENT